MASIPPAAGALEAAMSSETGHQPVEAGKIMEAEKPADSYHQQEDSQPVVELKNSQLEISNQGNKSTNEDVMVMGDDSQPVLIKSHSGRQSAIK